MIILEILAWALAGVGLGALHASISRCGQLERQVKLGFIAGLVGGVFGWVADVPDSDGFSYVSLLVAAGTVGCTLLLDWLLAEDRAALRL